MFGMQRHSQEYSIIFSKNTHDRIAVRPGLVIVTVFQGLRSRGNLVFFIQKYSLSMGSNFLMGEVGIKLKKISFSRR